MWHLSSWALDFEWVFRWCGRLAFPLKLSLLDKVNRDSWFFECPLISVSASGDLIRYFSSPSSFSSHLSCKNLWLSFSSLEKSRSSWLTLYSRVSRYFASVRSGNFRLPFNPCVSLLQHNNNHHLLKSCSWLEFGKSEDFVHDIIQLFILFLKKPVLLLNLQTIGLGLAPSDNLTMYYQNPLLFQFEVKWLYFWVCFRERLLRLLKWVWICLKLLCGPERRRTAWIDLCERLVLGDTKKCEVTILLLVNFLLVTVAGFRLLWLLFLSIGILFGEMNSDTLEFPWIGPKLSNLVILFLSVFWWVTGWYLELVFWHLSIDSDLFTRSSNGFDQLILKLGWIHELLLCILSLLCLLRILAAALICATE